MQGHARRRYADLESMSKYLDETDIGAGYQDDEGRGRQVPDRDDWDDMYKAGGAGLDDMCEGEGAGLDEMFEGKGEGLDDRVEGLGPGRQEQGQGSEGTNSEGEGPARAEQGQGRGASGRPLVPAR